MNEWFQEHWPDAGILAAGGVVIRWLFNREVKRFDETLEEMRESLRICRDRITDLEKDRVTRADFDEMRRSIMASIVHANERLEKQGEEMREERRQMHIENRETLDRIHERVDSLWERRETSRGHHP